MTATKISISRELHAVLSALADQAEESGASLVAEGYRWIRDCQLYPNGVKDQKGKYWVWFVRGIDYTEEDNPSRDSDDVPRDVGRFLGDGRSGTSRSYGSVDEAINALARAYADWKETESAKNQD